MSEDPKGRQGDPLERVGGVVVLKRPNPDLWANLWAGELPKLQVLFMHQSFPGDSPVQQSRKPSLSMA